MSALDLYLKQAEEGDADAQYNLGLCFDEGSDGVKQDCALAMHWYMKAALQGHSDAQYNVGLLFEEGRGWYWKAAEQGDAHAQFNIGWLYDEGKGVQKSYEKALEWYMKASEQGDEISKYKIGTFFEKGKVVKENVMMAMQWFEKSNSAIGRFKSSGLFMFSQGMERDFSEEFEWYSEYAGIGDSDAIYNLGIFYEFGIHVKQDYKKAFELYLKAAKRDDVAAQIQVGIKYLTGVGVEQNLGASNYWLSKSRNRSVDLEFFFDEPELNFAHAQFPEGKIISELNETLDPEKEFLIGYENQYHNLCVKHLKRSKFFSKILTDYHPILKKNSNVFIDIGNSSFKDRTPIIMPTFNSYVKYLLDGSLPDCEAKLKLIELAKHFGDDDCILSIVKNSHILTRFYILSALFKRNEQYHGAIVTCFMMNEPNSGTNYGKELTKTVLKNLVHHKDIAPIAKQRFVDIHFPHNPSRPRYKDTNVFYLSFIENQDNHSRTITFNNELFDFTLLPSERERKLTSTKKGLFKDRLQIYIQEVDSETLRKFALWIRKFDDSEDTLFTTSPNPKNRVDLVLFFDPTQ
ncbi:predicted protein [Naegleria gruberi]|uniref:Predicted protein n=1 Tax=Naegleria gruberi TaxID=5762 RepID=D2VYS9_NAEGR|nr:uncharacterized protein NAEGRDRAFT_74228 [Naegleria gruberi]EFC38010.1 predicted protein [Naegleria gruberi]|eukprot:XP_002670754.1 predicted protein [Naegleria gruberi strain NEG-M]